MFQYLIRRTLQSVPLLLIISLILFGILQLQPEKPWDLLLHRPNLTAAARDHILAYYGWDKPAWHQYGLWLWNLVHLDFGTSYFAHAAPPDPGKQRSPTTRIRT